GIEFIEQRTGVPVLGVLPFMQDLRLEEEDRLAIKLSGQAAFQATQVNVGIILLPHMSNFTDFDLLRQEHDVVLKYMTSPDALVGVDVVILPGSKSTQTDLKYLRGQNFQTMLEEHVRQGRELIGICGGYQMLGLDIHDPHGVEGGGSSAGLGFLEIDTILAREKMTTQVEAAALHFIGCSDIRVRGYHIHMGVTRRRTERPCFRITRRGQKREDVTLASADEDDRLDGAIRDGELVWGTYIHGVFDEPDFRRTWLNRVRRRKGLAPLAIDQSQALNARRSHELDRWADHLQQHIRLRPIWDGLTRRGRPHADFQSLYEDWR
ncbi:MAG: cobyric acid synthase, partial [Nitrospiraceae bacterium]